MTRSEIPTVVRLIEEPVLHAQLLAFGLFLGLSGQHPRRLIALKTRLLPQRRVGGIAHLCRSGGFLVVRFASHRRSQIDHLSRMGLDQHEVLVRRRFLLAAGLLLVLRGIGWTLAPALRAVYDHIGSALQGKGAAGDPARIAFRRHAESGSGALPDGEQGMHPIVALGLTPLEWQTVHRLQRIGLLVDEEEEQLVFPVRQNAFGAAAALALASLAFPRLVWRIAYGIGGSKGRQYTRKLFVRQAGRGQELSRSVL